jgi:MT0933-like antitoxin protein
MPKIKNLAALAAAVEAGRRYARSNPDKAGRYVDQAAEFVDNQTKGKYRGQIEGVVSKVKGAAGLPNTPRHGVVGNGSVQGFEANAGYGKHQGYGQSTPLTPPVTPSTTTPSTGPSASTTPPKPTAREQKPTTGEPYPGSKDL